jgi:hypothetical protein
MRPGLGSFLSFLGTGGPAAALGPVPLLTRDAKRYRNYFPSVRLIAP